MPGQRNRNTERTARAMFGAILPPGCGRKWRWRPRAADRARDMCGVFFFQAEDGIRDVAVTGVQTCALPIWGRFVENFKLVISDPRLMKLLWSHLTVEEAREMGLQNGNSAVVEFILYYFRKFDLESVLKTFRVIGAEYSNAFAYSESGDDRNRTIILRHSMGQSASAYYGASLKALSVRLGMEVKLEETDDQLVCKIRRVDKEQAIAPKTPKAKQSQI